MSVTAFWLLAAAMLIGALALLAPALLRGPHGRGIARGELNLAIHRQRLAELTAERDAGLLTAETFEQTRHELEQRLLHDIDDVEPVRGVAGQRPAWRTLVLVATVLPVLAGVLYIRLGTPELAALPTAGGVATDPAPAAEGHAVADMVARLAARLQVEPDDAEGWAMLGRSYVVLQQPGQAAQAFAKAHALLGDQPALLADYAEALALADGASVVGKPLLLARRALALEPDNRKALWLAGVAAMHLGDGAQAAQHWRRLARLLPSASREAQHLQQYIAAADGSDTAAGVDVAVPSPDASAAAGIEVAVSLAPALVSRTAPDAVLFVYARATQGPRMPLAIVRHPARALPLTVRLDDSQAMAPNLTLSGFSEVVVGARISQTGNATPQSGDLQGQSGPLRPGSTASVAVVIDQVLP